MSRSSRSSRRLLFSWLRTHKSLRNGSISLKLLVCNHFAAFSVCCYVIITKLARYNEKTKTDVGTLWWAEFFLKRLDINGLISLKCMVCNHFVAFSVCCCVIITEFARYDEKN